MPTTHSRSHTLTDIPDSPQHCCVHLVTIFALLPSSASLQHVDSYCEASTCDRHQDPRSLKPESDRHYPKHLVVLRRPTLLDRANSQNSAALRRDRALATLERDFEDHLRYIGLPLTRSELSTLLLSQYIPGLSSPKITTLSTERSRYLP